MSLNKKSKYNVVDLFAGAGGLSYGFMQTGRFTIKAAFENNRNAMKTYERNHNNTMVYNDVADALNDEIKLKLGKVDVVIGGPPCQGFSNANRQKNHAISQNNSLVKRFIQIVLDLKPMAFVMENVSMLKSDVHRFYVDENDKELIDKYNIKTTPSEILLIEPDFIFEDIVTIVNSEERISNYLWEDKSYLSLNVVYKTRKNSRKLCNTLERHKKILLSLSDMLIESLDTNDAILKYFYNAGIAIQEYFANKATYETAIKLCEAIKPSIMIQRMLSKANEILDNRIVVNKYSTDNGLVAHVSSMAVIDYIESILGSDDNGYSINYGVLSATAFGIPQKRKRFVLIGISKTTCNDVKLPVGMLTEKDFCTVEDAIKDLEEIETVTDVLIGNKGVQLTSTPSNISKLGKQLRDSEILFNHVSTATTPEALERFKAIKQGDNFHSLPPGLKSTYFDTERTQNTIYLRLKYDEPSGTVVNVRKSMWIHPVKDRALSIREAARLQTFPDSFVFCGTKDSQYQQIGNAVPPMLAKAIAEHICRYLDSANSGL